MVDGFKVEVKGVKELQATLLSLGVEVMASITEGVNDAAKEVEADAKRRARVRTGAMRDSVREMARNTSLTSVEVQVGTDISYGPANEFGTSRMSAQPFVRPALDENAAQIKSKIELKVSAIIMRHK